MKRILLVALAAGAALLLPAASAFAHVTVNPREAAQGSYAKLAFRVPNERDGVNTTKLEVDFPTDHPLASVSVRPHPGWTYTVEKDKVTWTGGVIKPGEFDEFEVSVGPLPDDADSLTFKALQTYSDGQIVRWIEQAPANGAAADHPAPVLRLTKASTPAATTATTAAPSAPAPEAQGGQVADGQKAASKSDVDSARMFGLLGLAFGVLGFATALAGRRQRSAAA